MADLELLRRRFGKRLRHLRRVRDITQDQLAGMIGRAPNSISQLETGSTSPSFETLILLAQALDVGMEELFKFDWKG